MLLLQGSAPALSPSAADTSRTLSLLFGGIKGVWSVLTVVVFSALECKSEQSLLRALEGTGELGDGAVPAAAHKCYLEICLDN